MQVQLKSLHNISEVFSMKTNHIFGYTRLVTPRKKKKKKREFQEFLKYFTPDHYSSAQQKASLNQWPTSVLHCEQNLNTSQQRIILKKEGWFIDFPFFSFSIFAAFTTKVIFAWTTYWKAWERVQTATIKVLCVLGTTICLNSSIL